METETTESSANFRLVVPDLPRTTTRDDYRLISHYLRGCARMLHSYKGDRAISAVKLMLRGYPRLVGYFMSSQLVKK